MTVSRHNFYVLCGYSLVLGALVGLVTVAFLRVLHGLEHVLWDSLPALLGEPPLYPLLLCGLGGLLVGLCQHFLGDYPQEFREMLEEVRAGHVDSLHVWQGAVLSLVSLGFGAALGPEAALLGVTGGLILWVTHRLKVSAERARQLTYLGASAGLGAFFGSPFGGAALPLESPEEDSLPSTGTFIPGILAGLAGLAVVLLIPGEGLFGRYDIIPYEAAGNGLDIVRALPFALLGSLLGLGYLVLDARLNKLLAPLRERKLLLALSGGLLFGGGATLFPLLLFSGQEGLQIIMSGGEALGALHLVLIGLLKVAAVSLLLATGWKGGPIFPMIFGGASLGLGIVYLFPIAHPMVALCASAAGTTSVMLKRPLATLLIMLVFFPGDLIVVLAVGAVVGTLFIGRHEKKLEAS